MPLPADILCSCLSSSSSSSSGSKGSTSKLSSSSSKSSSSSSPSSTSSGSGSGGSGSHAACELTYCSGYWTFTGYDGFGCSTGFLTTLYDNCVDLPPAPDLGQCTCPSDFGFVGPRCDDPEYPDPPYWDGLVLTIACYRAAP